MSNINFTYTNLTPFKWYVLENFPFIEADFDALTNWQLFCKLGKEMNKIINSVNVSGEQVETLTNAFNELQNYVNNYFSELNVQEEINKKLDEMAEDGTLAEIINEHIFGELNTKINNAVMKTDYQYPELSSKRIARWFQETGRYTDGNDPSKSYYGYLQGNKILDDGNFVGAYSCFDDEHKYISNKCAIRVISMATGNILRENIIDCGHGNCISYDKENDYLYITECFRYSNEDPDDSSSIPSQRVFILKYSDLSQVNIFTITGTDINERLLGFNYDETLKKYFATQGGKVFEINMSNHSVVNTITLKQPATLSGIGNQTTQVQRGKIYQVTINPNIILVYDLEGNLENIYNIPYWIEHAFYTGEVEDLTVKENGDIYIGSCKWACYQSNYTVSQIFIINPIKGVCERNLYGDQQASNQVTVYIDSNFRVNPTGYNSAPFNEIFELSEFLMSPAIQNKGCCLAQIKNGSYHFAYFGGGVPLQIQGENNENTILNGLVFRLMNHVILRNVKLGCESKSYPNPIDITMSNLDIGDIRFVKNASKYNTYIKTSNNTIIKKSGTFPAGIDTDNTAIVDLGFGCKYCDNDMIVRKNLRFSSVSSFLEPSLYPLTDPLSITDTGSNIPLNSFLTNNNIDLNTILSNFNYIVFEYTNGGGGYHLSKFRIGGTEYGVGSTNIANTEPKFYLNEMNITIDNNKITVSKNQRADQDSAITQNVQTALTRIYLTNNI